ncbi:MAG: DUF6671 family protein [Cyanobium sp.]
MSSEGLADPSPYAGSAVAMATRHGKERVVGRAIHHGLGASLLHLPEIDTDALGSFCGTVPRPGTARQACLAKAELALLHGGTGLAIASEGSFGPHPLVPMLPVGIETMVFLDRERGLTIEEVLQACRTNFAHRRVAAADLAGKSGCAVPGPDLARWLQAVGFPGHALLVRPHAAGPCDALPRKGLHTPPDLLDAVVAAMERSSDGCALLETDMRAHCNPTRMACIRRLAFRLVRRVATPCPACRSPGFGVLEVLPGLPCAWCGTPTNLLLWEVLGCVACNHRERRRRRDGLKQADPGHCPLCNP